MDIRIFMTVFATIFLAELGDKTQLATLLFSADKNVSKLGVFFAAALALILTSAIGVAVGGCLSHVVNRKLLSIIAGIAFVGVGIWTIVHGIRTPPCVP